MRLDTKLNSYRIVSNSEQRKLNSTKNYENGKQLEQKLQNVHAKTFIQSIYNM